jgi:hypothetical protein
MASIIFLLISVMILPLRHYDTDKSASSHAKTEPVLTPEIKPADPTARHIAPPPIISSTRPKLQSKKPKEAEQTPAAKIEQFGTQSIAQIGSHNHAIIVNPPFNPNAPVTYYSPDGQYKTVSAGGTRVEIGGLDNVTRFTMPAQEAARQHDWIRVRELASSAITAVPEWSTPHYLAGLAELELCDTAAGQIELKKFIASSSSSPEFKELVAEATHMLDISQSPEAAQYCHRSEAGTQ